ncbi:MAG: PD-(D/E)XK nuclease family protein [Methanomassiliicoccales archaeon]|nr:MAG: PD-(D/E)XK nuclease family protein [Methanomassiliicoccales archaeon]
MSKKKTLTTIFEDFKFEPPACPYCKSSKRVVKSGKRSLKEDMAQIYLCRTCNKRFSDRKLPRTSYPPKVILAALTYYNQGHTLDMTVRTMRRKYKTKIPITTLNSWISRHKEELPFTKLRKKYDLDPNQTIKTRKLFHPQPYLFRVHTLKLNIKGKQFPQLKRYINNMLNNPMDHLFQSKKVLRVSELANTINLTKPLIRTVKNSPASRMTDLALELAKTKSERHQKVEEFFLINDSATVAVEVPVYLTEVESGFKKPLTGHIDLIQVRSNRIHIMDYKPDESGNVVNQLSLYAKCLKKRTGLSNIICSYFDENGYFQFTPIL